MNNQRNNYAYVELCFQITPYERKTAIKIFTDKILAKKYADNYLCNEKSWVSKKGLCKVHKNGYIEPIIHNDDDDEEDDDFDFTEEDDE